MSESAAQRPQSTARAGFGYGLRLARAAWLAMVARPGLAAAVVTLATAGYFSSAFVEQHFGFIFQPKTPAQWQRYRQQTKSGASFAEKWARRYKSDPLAEALWTPAGALMRPLDPPTGLAVWAGAPLGWFVHRVAGTGRGANAAHIAVSLVLTVPILLAYPLLLVPLLGWVRDGDRRLRISAWPRYWRDYYVPVLLVTLVFEGIRLVILPLYVTLYNAIDGNVGSPLGLLRELVSGVMLLPGILLFLAPFTIVGQRLGAGKGMREGLRLLRRNWAALLALFTAFRIGYEVLAVWNGLAPWPVYYDFIELSIGAKPLLWLWARYVGLALLGLWAAYAFMEMAREPKAPAAAVS